MNNKMKRTFEEKLLLTVMIIFAAWFSALAVNEVLAADARFCGVVYRDAVTHKIIRSAAVVRAFKKEHPCVFPCNATWQVDHIYPLSEGGCDILINMQYLPPEIKSCAGLFCKDRWERQLYSTHPFITIYK